MCATKTIDLQVEIFVTTKIGKGTPFKRHITKAIELRSKFIEDNAKSREQKITSCMRKKPEGSSVRLSRAKMTNVTVIKLSKKKKLQLIFCSLLLAFSSVNFDVCSIAFVMYLLNGVPFSIFVLIRDYCTLLSLDGFLNATTSLSFTLKYLSVTRHLFLNFRKSKGQKI